MHCTVVWIRPFTPFDCSCSSQLCMWRQRGDMLYEVLTLCCCVSTRTPLCRLLLHAVCQFRRGSGSNYYYSRLLAAVVTMATAGVRQQL